MKNNNQIVVTLFFEGATYLTKVKDSEITSLKATRGIDPWGNFAGCDKYSVDVELKRHLCKMDIQLNSDQLNNYPSDSALRTRKLSKRMKNFESQWAKMSIENKAALHAQDFMHDRNAESFSITIQ